MSQLDTTPAEVDFATTDARTLAFDFTNVIAVVGGSLSGTPTLVLTDITATPKVITSHGTPTPTISGTLVEFGILGTDLTVGHQYRVTIVAVVNAQTFTARCTIDCIQ